MDSIFIVDAHFKSGLERKVLYMAEETTATNTTASQDAQNTSSDTQTTSTTVNSTDTKSDSKTDQTNSIEELIQRAVDRATNKLGNENKKLRESVTKLQKEHLSENELKEIELREKEADIADREAKLQEKINREFALKSIKEAGLDDGGSNSLELIDFVVCDSEEATLGRVKAFSELVNKFVKAEVDKTFKMNGRNPNSTTTEGTNINQTVVESLGALAADRKETTNQVLKHYLGG